MCLLRARALTARGDAADDYDAMLLCDRLAREWLRLAQLIMSRESIETSDYDAMPLVEMLARRRMDFAAAVAPSECSTDEPGLDFDQPPAIQFRI